MSRSYAIINGATGGIGSVIAKYLASTHDLILLGRDEKKLQALSEKITYDFSTTNVLYYCVDMLQPKTLIAAAEDIQLKKYSIGALIHCVGVAPVGGVLEIEDKKWHDTIQTSFMSAVYLVKYFSPMMQKMGGSIVIINGIFAIQPDANFVVSASITGALRNFAKAISKELISSRIRVNSILPGGTKTPLWNEIANTLGQRFNTSASKITQGAATSNPSKRLADPKDIAAAVRFLCSDDATYINGAFINIDGGASDAM